jgi:hypothetical protein
MSSHHDHDNHSHEAKPVAFRTPLILGLVTILIILLAVSTCDKKHGCCEGDKEKCEASCESKHGEHGSVEAAGAEATTPLEAVETDEHTAVADSTVKADTAHVAVPAKTEEHTHH